MASAIDTALSGFNAATQRLNVSANNVANATSTRTRNADGSTSNKPYVPLQLEQSTQANGGVTTHMAPISQSSLPFYDPTNVTVDANGITQYPNVDVAQQLVQTQLSSYDAQGNLSVMKAQKNVFNSLINIIS